MVRALINLKRPLNYVTAPVDLPLLHSREVCILSLFPFRKELVVLNVLCLSPCGLVNLPEPLELLVLCDQLCLSEDLFPLYRYMVQQTLFFDDADVLVAPGEVLGVSIAYNLL